LIAEEMMMVRVWSLAAYLLMLRRLGEEDSEAMRVSSGDRRREGWSGILCLHVFQRRLTAAMEKEQQ
jgi:hypothetical protein